MIVALYALFLGAAGLTAAFPTAEKRNVTSLNQAAFAQAQQRDNTATRAFSSTEIKTASGQCLFVDELSGDFRANLTPVQVGDCDSSDGQKWDIITSGKHNNEADSMLVVSSLTQACLNFDPRRAAGNTVILFACGGRGDGTGQVTNSQLFPFDGQAGPLELTPENSLQTCLTVKGNVIDEAACDTGDNNQVFIIGDAAAAANSTSTSAASAANAVGACPAPVAAATSAAAAESSAPAATSSEIESETEAASTTSPESSTSSTSSSTEATTPAATTAAAQVGQVPSENPTSAVPVSRAGGVLNPTAAAEANVRDDTATRAFSSVSVKSADGQCLFIDPTAGDFRENLIPVQLQPCTGSANEKFDFITAGKHNNEANSTLIVSSLTQGCLNFDSRRAAGDTVIMFACGGRGDGTGQVTNSQLFPFTAGETSLTLTPENTNGATCLVPINGRLDETGCNSDASQLFTIS